MMPVSREAFGFDATVRGLLLAQHVERDMPQERQVVRDLAAARATWH